MQIYLGLLYFLLISSAFASDECSTSSLYDGTLSSLNPGGKLEDYSFVGYKAGAPLPTPTGFVNVKDYGAVGNGFKEDSGAFTRAITSAEAQGKNLYIPSGSYKLRKKFEFKRSNFVIQGEGPLSTKLLFKSSLADLNGNDQNVASGEYLNGGMIEFLSLDPVNNSTLKGRVISTAQRGEKSIVLNRLTDLRKGLWIRLVWSDPGESMRLASLANSLLDDKLSVVNSFRKNKLMSFMTPIKEISGTKITLVRPLPLPIKDGWEVSVHVAQQTVQDVGIQDLSIQFESTQSKEHLRERGYNGIFIENVKNCWIKNVSIINSDYGINLKDSHFCTLTGIKIGSSVSRGALEGHHGITVSGGSENLVEDFEISGKYRHDITSSTFSLHTVFSKGKGTDLSMDLHRMFPYATLFTEIDLGLGTRPFYSGGRRDRGPHSAAFTTFWNIWADESFTRPNDALDFGPSLNFIGVKKLRWMTVRPDHWSYEDFGNSEMCVPNLYRSMKLDPSWQGIYSSP